MHRLTIFQVYIDVDRRARVRRWVRQWKKGNAVEGYLRELKAIERREVVR